ncbi:MAG: hypothetical protein QOE77_1785 [Blastocatellia bacterium]|jgi:hypothetical protein|nr:hypothetical protein [Blastocatellia bacterium]
MKTIVIALFVIFGATGSAWAQLPRETDDPDSRPCRDTSGINLTLKTTGAYLPGTTIGIRSESSIWAETRDGKNHNRCKNTVEDLPRGKWKWQILERPAQSTSQLAGTNQEAVTLLLDQLGDYKIRFTACPTGCQIPIPDSATLTIDAESRDILVRVLAILPPDASPDIPVFNAQDRSTLPFKPTNPTTVSTHCAGDQGIMSSAWYTVLPWSGPSDYKLLEGRVGASSVSSNDSFLNHDGMDWGMEVTPHPWSRHLMGSNQSDLAVEWERAHLPEKMRPTPGDWISAVGYWIYDCDHDKKTEIHPPVLLAIQRARPISLPTNAGAGSNIYVPGIVTDIWVDREAGDITNSCAYAGLDQQKDPTKPPLVDAQGFPKARCLPDSEGFSSNPIKRVFKFNIYLPRSPQAIMAAIGKTAPQVPLFIEGCVPPGSLALDQPVCEQETAGGVTYLKVTIDLRSYNLPTYSRRIVAGWAHAAPDNWGVRRWNLRVTSLDISDDGDSLLRGDGDWRFWVNTNNGATEWTKLMEGQGNAHGNMTFGGKPWETNAPRCNSAINPGCNRSLGPAIVLFPNQLLQLGTSGFEEDWFVNNSISGISFRLGQRQASGSAVANDGSAKYTLHYQVLPGADIGRAQLSPAARARYDAYVVKNSDLAGGSHGLLLDRVFNSGVSTAKSSSRFGGEAEHDESLPVTRMSVTQLRQLTQRAGQENAAKINAFLQRLKRAVQRAKTAEEKADAHEFLKRLRSAVSSELWQKHGLEADMRVLVKTQ